MLLLATRVLADEPTGLFVQRGTGEVGTPSLQVSACVDYAETTARTEAESRCAPLTAFQVSDWDVSIHGYGLIDVQALFECKSAFIASAMATTQQEIYTHGGPNGNRIRDRKAAKIESN